MERLFGSRWQDRAGAVFMILIAAGCVAMGLYFPFARHFGAGEAWVPWTGIAFFSGLGGVLGALMLWGLLETFTVYSVDRDGITRKSVFGTRNMRWREVASYESRNTGLRATYILTDILGERLTIYLGLAANAAEIAEALDSGIARLRDGKIQDFERTSFTRKPGRAEIGAAVFTILFGAGFIVASAYVFLQADQMREPIFGRGVAIAGALMGLAFSGFLGLYLLTYTFRVDASAITAGSIFGERRIPFEAVKSIVSRDMVLKHGTMNTTWVEGPDGKKIQFNEAMPNYAELVAFVRKRAGAGASEAGVAALPSIEKRDLRRGALVMAILYPLMLAILVALAADPLNRLRRQFEIDRHGIAGVGRVTGQRIVSHDNSTLYIVDYAFTAQGRELRGASPLLVADYDRSRVGELIPIVYVPDRPGLCRTRNSAGRRVAIADLTVFGIYGALGIFGGISGGIALRRKWKKLQA